MNDKRPTVTDCRINIYLFSKNIYTGSVTKKKSQGENKIQLVNIFNSYILIDKFYCTKKRSSFPMTHRWMKYLVAKFLLTSS